MVTNLLMLYESSQIDV